MKEFLESSKHINWNHPEVAEKAASLSNGSSDKLVVAQACFQFVRDEIRHSWDHKMNPVTCRASDVLKHRTGYCYAKSHLLAALLRANGIPTGLCYQRLVTNDDVSFSLHGLNAAYLEKFGWYRIDARGNKLGVNAEFCPPIEKLAFPVIEDGEANLSEIWSEPLPVVVRVLESCEDYLQVSDNLPDIVLIGANKRNEANT